LVNTSTFLRSYSTRGILMSRARALSTAYDRVVTVSGRLVLVCGLGSVVGTLIGAILMVRFEIDGVFYFIATAYSCWRSWPDLAM